MMTLQRSSTHPARHRTSLAAASVLFAALLATPTLAAEEKVVLTEDDSSPSSPKQRSSSQPVVEENAGVMVRPFEGPKSQTIHDKVISTLEAEGIVLIPEGFEEGVKLADAPGPYIEVARKNQIKAYLHGQTKMTRRSWSVTLKVRNAADGKPVGNVTLSHYSLPGLLKKIDKDLMRELDAPLLKTSLPGAKGSKPKSKSAAASSEAEETEVTLEAEPNAGADVAADSGPIEPREEAEDENKAASPFDARVGVGVLNRSMQYQAPKADVYRHKLNPHNIAVPALRVGATVYPGAYLSDGMPAHLGVVLDFYRSVGGTTTVQHVGGPTDLTTTFTELRAGLRGRVGFSMLELGINGQWGFSSLVLDGDNEPLAGGEEVDPGILPDTEYTFFRFGPDVKFEFGAPIEVGLFWRVVALESADGYLAEDRWFPHAAAVGLDAHAAVSIELTEDIDLQIGGEARYYGINADPGPFADNTETVNGSTRLTHAVAAGLSDMYLGAFVSGTYTAPAVKR